jgi:hypothetical protein
MVAGSLERNAESEEGPWWFKFLPLRFQRRTESLRVSGTTIVRRLASGTFVVLAVLPKSANSTIIDCTIFRSRTPKPAEVEASKMRTSLEIDQLVAKAKDLRDQSTTASSALYPAQQAQVNELLETHMNAEKRLGAEIHPAARSQNFTLEGKADDDCKLPLSTS